MDTRAESPILADRLPAQRIDAAGRVHVDQRAIWALALPLMANGAVQIVLNLTDIWFIGRISMAALAAAGAVHWLVIVIVMVLGSVGMAVQTIVAQNHGSRRYVRASQATWTALWGTLLVAPLFIAAAIAHHWFLAPFGLPAEIERLASQYWLPRVGGAFFGAAAWAVLGFFNGIGRPRVSMLISALMTLFNVVLNQLFIFELGWGVAGAAWATTVAQALGLALAMTVFLQAEYRRAYRSHATWKPHVGRLWMQLRLGFPMGLLYAIDLVGFSIFQMMQVRLGAVPGAATQIVTMLTSIAYMPGLGIASAGTTLVGQAIGAGDRDWAMRLGTRIVALAALYMGGIGLFLALAGPWLLPLFAGTDAAESAAVVATGVKLLWIAAAYQLFDGMNLGSGLCLRGAGDVTVPAALVLVLSCFVFVPLAHSLTFAPGEGWLDVLPQAGWGPIGGWIAVVVYVMLLGLILFARWRSGAWKRIRL